MSIQFDGRVAIVTGAGGGLGRAYAIELARRGARVIVNDIGASLDGTGGTSDTADSVVAEIKESGGEAIANGSSVSDKDGVDNMVEQAMDAYGQIDILINNAGILRDKSFSKMEIDDFRAVLEVHLVGAAICSKAVWPIMNERQYGRILLTASVSGLWGIFGQTNYGSAKLGLIGFMNALKLEGQKNNIRVNTISPGALTRMTEGLMGGADAATKSRLGPEQVAPAAVYLVSDAAPTGVVLQVGGGSVRCVQIVETLGADLGEGHAAEDISANWEKICETSTLNTYSQSGAPAVDIQIEPL